MVATYTDASSSTGTSYVDGTASISFVAFVSDEIQKYNILNIKDENQKTFTKICWQINSS